MNSSHILSIVTFIYGFAAVFYITTWIFKNVVIGKLSTVTLMIALLGNSIGLALRWWESYSQGIGHAPLSNLYESLVFFSWSIALIYLVLEYRYKERFIGVFITPVAFLAIAYASLSPHIDDRIQPLIPALKSNWLIAHVMTCFLGYAGFTIAFGISVMYLLRDAKWPLIQKWTQMFPPAEDLDDLTHQNVVFGFLFLTIGIITGSVWANSAWGTYWSWDPKETWSLVTWLIYALLLHARLMRGWQGTRIAWLSILGFLAVLFTYFGVNYLPGLHSYGV